MDFFEAQDRARSRTKTLVLLFAAAAIATGFAIYLVISLALGYIDEGQPYDFWDPFRLAVVVGVTCAIMVLCSLFKIKSLSAGGSAVAAMLGGKRVSAQPTDPKLQQYRNVVEEMAIAAGCRVPEIFVLENESSINAFAAGYTLDNAAIAVSRGCLDQLDREELQGVVAHEFSHILNGDMRLNTRLIGIIFGILVIAVIGRIAFQIVGHGGGRARSSNSKGSGGVAFVLIVALAIMCIGYIGVLFGRLIQSAISRQREYLADAAAVQFTRNPSGISNALRRIKGASVGSRIQHPDSEEVGHMFFASGLKSAFGGPFATHPPLEKRIKAIDPNNLYLKQAGAKRPAAAPQPKPTAVRSRENFVESIATNPMAGAAMAAALLATLPSEAQAKAHDPKQAFDILLNCLHASNTKIAGRVLDPRERFALIEFALASLKHLSQRDIEGGLMKMESLAAQDHEIDFEEQCLLLAVKHNLRDWNTNANGKLALFPKVKKEFEIILSAIALSDDPEPTIAAAAFAQAQPAFNTFGTQVQPDFQSAQNPDAVGAAIEKASASIFNARKALIDAAARIAAHDNVLTDSEQAKIRALCLALSCPLPQ